MMRMLGGLRLAGLLAALCLVAGCGGDDEPEAGGACEVDRDCLGGELCDSTTGLCRPIGERCSSGDDCGIGETCSAGECVAVADGGGSGSSCGDGVCGSGETCSTCRLDCAASCGDPAFETSPIDHSMSLFSFPAIAVTPADRAVVAFTQADQQLRFAERTDGSWNIEPVPTATAVVRQDLAVDSDGRPWIVHTRGDDRQVWISWKDGSGWHHEAVRDATSFATPSIAIGADDVPRVSFNAKHAYRTGGGEWTVETISSGRDAGMTADPVPVFAYTRTGTFSSSCAIARRTPASYDIESLSDCEHRDGRTATVTALGSSGVVAIFPSEGTPSAWVELGSGWEAEPLGLDDDVREVSLVTDAAGRVHGVVGGEELHYVTRAPAGSWSALLLAGSSEAQGADLAVDSRGDVHIAWAESAHLSYGTLR